MDCYNYDCRIECPYDDCIKEDCKYYGDCASCHWFWTCPPCHHFALKDSVKNYETQQ